LFPKYHQVRRLGRVIIKSRAGDIVPDSQVEGGFGAESAGFVEEKADEPPNNGFVVVDDFVASVPVAGVPPNSPPDVAFGDAPNVETPAVDPGGFWANRPPPKPLDGLLKPPPRSPLPAVLVVFPPPKSPPAGVVEEFCIVPKRPLPGVVEDVLLAPNKPLLVFEVPKMPALGVPDPKILPPFSTMSIFLIGEMR
jgi:hypothetical protein